MALPDGTLALTLGTGLALAASAVVLLPLLREEDDPGLTAPRPAEAGRTPAREGASAIEALREIEFDRVTGKLSDDDYAELKATYTREALAELRDREADERRDSAPARPAAHPARPVAGVVPALASVGGGVASGEGDAVEAALAAFRARAARCPTHGARPQADARFCSDCGRYLAAQCPRCGAACEREGQRFCTDCGTTLAA